jgi:hypothetical protein
MTREESEEILERVAAQLSEHFDAVQILASWNEEGMSKYASRGGGNWYARQGMAHEFITQDQAQVTALEAVRVNRELED